MAVTGQSEVAWGKVGRGLAPRRSRDRPVGKSLGRKIARGCLLLGLWVPAAAGCAGSIRSVGPARAILRIQCDVADAVLWVNEKMIGEVRDLASGVRIAPGSYRLQFRHDRFHTRYLDVTLAAGETRALKVSLAERFE